jgi:uroporphyrinogen III methyltransferase/synthase
LADHLDQRELDARALACLKIACIGQATAEGLKARLAVRADFVPQRSLAESLAAELADATELHGSRCLILQADIARPELSESLTYHGAKVDTVVAYETHTADALPEDVVEALADGSVDWITFTSSSTASNLFNLLGDDASELLGRCKLASIGSKTSATLKGLGLHPSVEAATPGIQPLVDTIVSSQGPPR